jgi:hypothetical protein
MKSRYFLVPTFIGLILTVAVQTQEAMGQGRGQGFRPCPYTPYSCPVKAVCKPFDESGKVAQVLTESLEEGMYPGMVVLMDTKSRGRVRVHLGPVWYLERQEFQLAPGDEIRVKGMCDQKDGKTDVVAFELSRGNYVLHLRDAQGRPNWEAWRQK